MPFSVESWNNPPKEYRVKPIIHNWPNDAEVLMDAVNDFGFGGVVTNPSHKNWYEGYRDNVKEFAKHVEELEKRDLSFWFYDEKGYPSGQAGGEVLKGHPELEAKGFYMRRMVAYAPRHAKFHLDDESDKIVWAAKYPLNCPRIDDSYVLYEQMQPVPFTDTFCETDLNEREVFFVFCVKPAYEGSHCTHNVSSFSRYINVMDKRAVRRFIDLIYEPLAEIIPDLFSRTQAVFTDEPSLQVGYMRSYESWPYALAPWVDDLFERYEQEYGTSLLPYLPLLFEGRADAYPIRINFYQLVGKLIAEAYSGQIADWCRDHGGVFSGHYLCEETIAHHVLSYGSFVEVVRRCGYPGLDVLFCYPEDFDYNNVKYTQIAARKMGADGMMVEFCPFAGKENFNKAPMENTLAMMGILMMHGVRRVNSYFSSNFVEYAPDVLTDRKGAMHREEAQLLNTYVGRMGLMLGGLQNRTNVFVYYGLEDTQGKMKPQTTQLNGREQDADRATMPFTRRLLNSGVDFYYADREDVVAAASCDGTPVISGNEVKLIIVPALDIMHDDAFAALQALKNKGVEVLFLQKVPQFGTTIGETAVREGFVPSDEDAAIAKACALLDLTVNTTAKTMMKARFMRDGKEISMLENLDKEAATISLAHGQYNAATLYFPESGEILPVKMGEDFTLPSYRVVFAMMDT